jgi:hypothetical protein
MLPRRRVGAYQATLLRKKNKGRSRRRRHLTLGSKRRGVAAASAGQDRPCGIREAEPLRCIRTLRKCRSRRRVHAFDLSREETVNAHKHQPRPLLNQSTHKRSKLDLHRQAAGTACRNLGTQEGLRCQWSLRGLLCWHAAGLEILPSIRTRLMHNRIVLHWRRAKGGSAPRPPRLRRGMHAIVVLTLQWPRNSRTLRMP